MFDKLKQLHQLKKAVEAQRVEVEKNGVRVTMTGSFEIEELKLNPELSIEEQESSLKHCLKEAKDKIQSSLAKSMF